MIRHLILRWKLNRDLALRKRLREHGFVRVYRRGSR